MKYIKILKDESGYASFVIALVTIIVVSLIVIAFSADSRVEQKNTLTNNLATQAYYAAESGVNDAYGVISYDVANNFSISHGSGNNCVPATGSAYSATSQNLNSNVSYTCLIVNTTPKILSYPNVKPGQYQVVELNNSADLPMSTITISWQDNELANNQFTQCPLATANAADLPAIDSYPELSQGNCNAGVLQADLISSQQLSNELGSTNPSISDATSFFLEPADSNAPTAVTSGTIGTAQDQVIPVNCNNSGTYDCTYEFKGLPQIAADSIYYLKLQSFYADESVAITATYSSGKEVSFSDAEVTIDSTGEANGQYKRIQENVCYGDYCNSKVTGGPTSAIQSQQCIYKKFGVYPGEQSTVNPGC